MHRLVFILVAVLLSAGCQRLRLRPILRPKKEEHPLQVLLETSIGCRSGLVTETQTKEVRFHLTF